MSVALYGEVAVKAVELKARIIVRGWRIKRDDLDAYVRKL